MNIEKKSTPFSIIAKSVTLVDGKGDETAQLRSFVLMNCSIKTEPILFEKLEIFFEKPAQIIIHLWGEGGDYGIVPLNTIGTEGKVILKNLLLNEVFHSFKPVERIGFSTYQGDVKLDGIISQN